jgi:hypothetical protein
MGLGGAQAGIMGQGAQNIWNQTQSGEVANIQGQLGQASTGLQGYQFQQEQDAENTRAWMSLLGGLVNSGIQAYGNSKGNKAKAAS